MQTKLDNIDKVIKESQSYVESFYTPEFSPYSFMCLFTAIKASQNNLVFNRDILIKFIRSCKSNNQFSRLLHDIRIKNNGIFDYSDDLHEAIQRLRIAGIVYTISPELDASMYIYPNIPIAELIKERLDYFDEMENFIESYEKYALDIISQVQQDCIKLERLK